MEIATLLAVLSFSCEIYVVPDSDGDHQPPEMLQLSFKSRMTSVRKHRCPPTFLVGTVNSFYLPPSPSTHTHARAHPPRQHRSLVPNFNLSGYFSFPPALQGLVLRVLSGFWDSSSMLLSKLLSINISLFFS